MDSVNIKIARIKRGKKYTQRYVASELGMTPETYSQKERGRAKFTDKEKVNLAKLLGLTPEQMNDWLYDGLLPIGEKNVASW